MSRNGVTALVLAGQRGGVADPMAVQAGVSHKALIPILGVPMILRVIAALQAAPGIGRIIISSDLPDHGFASHEVLRRESGPSPSGSVAAVLQEFGAPLLVTTADHPLLTAEMIGYFLDHVPGGADAAAAVARSEVILAAYPATTRSWIRLRDGSFSGCNVFLLRTAKAAGVVAFWRHLEQQRKSPLAMARMIGPIALIGSAVRLLSMQRALQLVGRRAGAALAVVAMPFADAAVDVDNQADFELASLALAQPGGRVL
jgi:molybdopterin-guanine dinucleotide biosynthesis protein A